MTGPEGGDGPDVIGHAYGNPEPIEMPETGILLIKNAINVLSYFHNIIPLMTGNYILIHV